jgi:hypothetical protein
MADIDIFEISEITGNGIIVTGSGRSGTSAITRVLNILGASLGDNLITPSKDNPKGFWEHKDIVTIHESFLKESNSYWDDIRPVPDQVWEGDITNKYLQKIVNVLIRDFKDTKLWCIKDPRISRLIKLWHPIIEHLKQYPSFIITYRNPLDFFDSLDKVQRISKEKALLLWFLRTIEVEYETQRYPRVFISHEEFLYNWRKIIDHITDRLKIQWPNYTEEAFNKIDNFINSKQDRYSTKEGEFFKDKEIPAYIKQLYSCLEKGYSPEDLIFGQTFLNVKKEYDTEMELFIAKAYMDDLNSRNEIHSKVLKQLALKTDQVEELKNDILKYKGKLRKIQESPVWQVSKPFRQIYNKLNDYFIKNKRDI